MACQWRYHLCDVWLACVNAGACAFAFAVAALYHGVRASPILNLMVRQLDPRIHRYFPATIAASYILATGHILLAIRHLLFGVKSKPRLSSITTVIPIGPATEIVPVFSSWSPRKVTFSHRSSRLVHWWNKYSAEIRRVRMLWEVALQTFQANKTTQLVANVWINRVMAVVIMTNCWFSPLLHYSMRGYSTATMRLRRLVIDAYLDLTYTIIIPLTIFLPYYWNRQPGGDWIPFVNYYMDSWYTNAVSKLRQVFVTSWLDYVSKMSAMIALLYRLFTVNEALVQAKQQRRTSLAPQQRPSIPTSKVSKLLDAVLVLWGVCVVGLHLHTSINSYARNHNGCLLEMRPWGSPDTRVRVLKSVVRKMAT